MNDTLKRDKAAKPNPGPSDPQQAGLGLGVNAPAASYRVLARKYRPSNFDDLIGQEAMVRTISNAFETGRIPQAWILTGVRGVGKTTTARILARALNFELPDGSVTGPAIRMPVLGVHCRAIMESRHIDVIEMDAASHNGVDDVRQINDAVRYAPVSARTKVYILDEVHMLSSAAFNALLKTLEEPPPHAKFIFATTEIRKVPVTILSRTQRFDLRRVEPDVLVKHFDKISAKEGARIEMDALALIARAAEGSVRDGLSLLDQAIVQTDRGQTVTSTVVRDMLGLADRGQTIALFENVMAGKTKDALEGFRALWGFGADPAVVMLDVLDHCHGAAVSKALGPDALSMPKEQAARLGAIGAHTSAGTLSRLWQMLLKAHEEVRRAPDAMAAAEMALIRLCYAADLPGPEEALKALRDGQPMSGGPGGGGSMGGGASGGAVNAQARVMAAPAAQAAPTLASFEDVVKLIAEKRDIGLRLDVEQYVRPISFRPGAITFEPAPGAPGNLAGRLVRALKEWTGQPWLVAAEGGGGAESLLERQKREDREELDSIKADPFVASVLSAFPGAEIVEVRKMMTPEAP